MRIAMILVFLGRRDLCREKDNISNAKRQVLATCNPALLTAMKMKKLPVLKRKAPEMERQPQEIVLKKVFKPISLTLVALVVTVFFVPVTGIIVFYSGRNICRKIRSLISKIKEQSEKLSPLIRTYFNHINEYNGKNEKLLFIWVLYTLIAYSST
jgi:hypothetical protein